HPLQVLDARFQRLAEVGDQGLHLGLGLGRELDLHVQLAQGFTGLVVDRAEHALPARLHFLLAAQGGRVEVEVLLHELVAQERRGAVDGVEAQVGLPHRRIGVGQGLVDLLVEVRHRQRELLRRGHALRLEELRPGEVRGQRVGVGQADRVVVQRDVAAQVLARLGGLGQAGLEGHDLLRLLGGRGGFDAGQLQDAGDVGDVLLADVLLVRVEVVLAVRQAQAGLAGVGDVQVRILEVGFGAEAEQEVPALGGAGAQVFGDGVLVRQRVDRRQFGRQRLDALGVDLRLVHAGGPQVADDLLHAGGGGVGAGLFGQLLLDGVGALVEHLERAPAGAVARDRVGGQPLAIGVAGEIGAGFLGLVQVGQLEAADRRQPALVQGQGRLAGGRGGFVLGAGGQRGGDGQRQQQGLGLADVHGGRSPALAGVLWPRGGAVPRLYAGVCRTGECRRSCVQNVPGRTTGRAGMDIEFHGAAGGVTGSMHLVEAAGRRILLDCGMLQGGRELEAGNAEPFPFDPAALDAVVVSHAHIDHIGRLPQLVARGYRGPVWLQRATADLLPVMLEDAASLAASEAERANRRRHPDEPRQAPLFTTEDVAAVLRLLRPLDYDVRTGILPGVELALRDAGHILGSCIVELWGDGRKLVFSGDLGPKGTPILRDPSVITEADLVVMESTYGDRDHRERSATVQELGEVFEHAWRDGGTVLIPAFAVGRSQELLYWFARYWNEWKLERWRIFLDSPMAGKVVAVYDRHHELFDEQAIRVWRQKPSPFRLPNLHY